VQVSMQRFCQMCGLNFLTPRQIHALRAMIGTCGQIELRHRSPHQTLTFIQQFTKLPYLPTRISALQTISDEPVLEKRWLCMFLVACTCTNGVEFPKRSPLNFFIIDGELHKISMISNRPKILFDIWLQQQEHKYKV
jgi:hypothetical protein